MAGSGLGKIFRLTVWGESHGPAIGAVIEGTPAGLPIRLERIERDLARRRPGSSALSSPRAEADRCEILSGVFEGVATGAPISIMIWNLDARPEAYEDLKNLFRPGSADYSYTMKYGIRDHRGGGRASARLTAPLVAAGAIAKEALEAHGVEIYASVKSIGDVCARGFERDQIERNLVRCADPIAAEKMIALIEAARKEGDSLGGVIEVVAVGAPAGLGEPIYDRLDADLAKALMSVNAVKGVQIGAGFDAAAMKGSRNNDPITIDEKTGAVKFGANNSGGIDGGVSTGADIIARVALKPTPSIRKEQQTISTSFEKRSISIEGRHDPCVAPRAVPIVEAMMAVTLLDHLLRDKATRL